MLRSLLGASALAALALSSASAEPLKVVTSFSILGDMTARVGGDRVSVSTLVGPGGDAHVYQPSPKDARMVADADLVIVNGLKFEGFIERVIAAAEYKGPVVVAAEAVKPIEGFEEEDDHGAHAEEAGHDHAAEEAGHDHAAEEAGHDHAAEEAGHDHAAEETHAEAGHDDHDHGHDHGGFDPHAWQSLQNGATYVTAIEKGLCTVDPEGCPAYTERAASYRAEILALDADVRARIAAIPAERRVVITSHDAFGYFARDYGVRFLAPQGVSTEAEASASDVGAIVKQIRALGVQAIFLENMVDPRLAEQIARESGAVIGGTLYADALSGPDESGSSYLAMMKSNADLLIQAMAPRS